MSCVKHQSHLKITVSAVKEWRPAPLDCSGCLGLATRRLRRCDIGRRSRLPLDELMNQPAHVVEELKWKCICACAALRPIRTLVALGALCARRARRACCQPPKSPQEVVDCNQTTKGFGGTTTVNIKIGTSVWKWSDNEGKEHLANEEKTSHQNTTCEEMQGAIKC